MSYDCGGGGTTTPTRICCGVTPAVDVACHTLYYTYRDQFSLNRLISLKVDVLGSSAPLEDLVFFLRFMFTLITLIGFCFGFDRKIEPLFIF